MIQSGRMLLLGIMALALLTWQGQDVGATHDGTGSHIDQISIDVGPTGVAQGVTANGKPAVGDRNGDAVQDAEGYDTPDEGDAAGICGNGLDDDPADSDADTVPDLADGSADDGCVVPLTVREHCAEIIDDGVLNADEDALVTGQDRAVIDITVGAHPGPGGGVPADRGLTAWQYSLNWDLDVLDVDAHNGNFLILATGSGSPFTWLSLFRNESPFVAAASDAGPMESGPGVISRVTVEGNAAGIANLTLSGLVFKDQDNETFPVDILEVARVAVSRDGYDAGAEIGDSPGELFTCDGPAPPPCPTNCPPPPNDNFEDATTVGALPFKETQSGGGATLQPGEPQACSTGLTVWFTYTPPEDTWLRATMGAPSTLAVYKGTALSSLTQVDCGNGSHSAVRLTVLAHAGEPLHFQAHYYPYTGSIVFELLELSPPANGSFTVNSTDDPGSGACDATECTFREAIVAANAWNGRDTIAFDIPGPGPHTIAPAYPLPEIYDPLVIDGTTEPDFAGTPMVELDGTLVTPPRPWHWSATGLSISAGDSSVKGLVINRFGRGIYLRFGFGLDRPGGYTISGNYIGTDVTGTVDLGNFWGVLAEDSHGSIGGATPGEGNVISGTDGAGIAVSYASGPYAIQGNLIGTDASGRSALGNGRGVSLGDASDTTIGGTAPGTRNVISGNTGSGVSLSGATENRIEGNFIGTDVTGGVDLGNGGDGVTISDSGSTAGNNTIGGVEPAAGNVIAFNGGVGVHVQVESDLGNAVLGNSIFANDGLGIDLSQDETYGAGVTPNDPGDNDYGGGNDLQNFPVVNAVSSRGATGTLNSAPNTAYALQFYVSRECDPLGFGEGEKFIGRVVVSTDGSGDARFTADFEEEIPRGWFVTATATDPRGSTSEFSACRVNAMHGGVDANPTPTPNPGATPTPAASDSDADGVPDAEDLCPISPAGASTDAHGCMTAYAHAGSSQSTPSPTPAQTPTPAVLALALPPTGGSGMMSVYSLGVVIVIVGLVIASVAVAYFASRRSIRR